MTASWLRWMAAWYIDFVIWTTGLALLSAATGNAAVPIWLALIVFLPLRAFTGWLTTTPGAAILGINAQGEVDRAIVSRESRLSFAIAAFFLDTGIRGLTQWIDYPYPMPLFGLWPTGWWIAVVDIVAGLMLILTAVLLFRVMSLGWYLALGQLLLCIAATVVDWSAWDGVVTLMIHHRRALQNLPIRPGEIEFITAIFPEVMIAIGGAMVSMLLLTWRTYFGHEQHG